MKAIWDACGWVGRLAVGLAVILGIGKPVVAAPHPSPEAAGQALVARLLARAPESAQTNRGALVVRPPRGTRPVFEVPLEIAVYPTRTGWGSFYQAGPTPDGRRVRLWIERVGDGPPRYWKAEVGPGESWPETGQPVESEALMQRFAQSDFWLADLGMQFLYWPRQRLIRSEMRRGQFCDVLESEDPAGPTVGYGRVRAWWDRDTGGLVHAEALDTRDRVWKEFSPRVFRKIEGRWEVTELEMIDRQAGSRTRLVLQPGSEGQK